MTPGEVSRWLSSRAESYSRDAFLLRRDGQTNDALMYEAIRDELRKAAALVRNTRDADLCGLCGETTDEGDAFHGHCALALSPQVDT